MPILLSTTLARRRFDEALAIARSDAVLPPEWLERTARVATAPNKTFSVMLGTALLARSTDVRIDPFALKARAFARAYSARTLCTAVLVPAAVEAHIHMGTTGREPLNNQPFFRYDRVSPEMAVHPATQPHLEYLCDALEAVDRLDGAGALEALAAFLRVRVTLSPGVGPAPRLASRSLAALVRAAEAFVTRDPEGGKRGQALVAAALELVFPDVRTSRVNDPSRHWPGDVAVLTGRTVTLAAEVKQRPAEVAEIQQFASRLERAGVRRGIVAALAARQPALPVRDLRSTAWDRHGVHLSIFVNVHELVLAAVTWTAKGLDRSLEDFPAAFARRLAELEVRRASLDEWVALSEHS